MKKLCLILLLAALFSSCRAFQSPDQTDPELQCETTKKFVGEEAGIEVLLHLYRKEIDVSDFLSVTVEIRAKDGKRIIEPYLPEEAYHPLSPVGSPRAFGFWSAEKERHIKIWKYKFEPSEPGVFSLKPFEIFFRPSYKIKTGEISYLVKTSATAEDDIRDIKGPELPGYDPLPLTVAGGISALIAFSLYLGLGRGKRKKEKEPAAKSGRDCFLEALRRLEELERRDLIGKRQFEPLHVGLSDILRRYIEDYFGIRAAEQTTEEFLKGVGESSSFSDERQAALRDFLSLADLVKFAAFEPRAGVNEEAMRKVKDFIIATGEKTNEI